MRATIVVSDNMVKVDNLPARHVDCAMLTGEGLHAVQWYDTFGEKEFVTSFVDVPVLDAETNEPTDVMTKRPDRKPNAVITDFTPFQPFIDAYHVENNKKTAEEEAFQEKMEHDKQTALLLDELNVVLAHIWRIERDRLGHTPPPEFNPRDHLPKVAAEKFKSLIPPHCR